MLPKKFSQLSRSQRFKWLVAKGVLSSSGPRCLEAATPPDYVTLAETLIENAIGCQALPLGVVPEVVVDNKSYVVPMAIEESSVVAAAASAAKVFRLHGEITTLRNKRLITGQLHFMDPLDASKLHQCLVAQKTVWIDKIHSVVIPSMHKRGGGIHGITGRVVKAPGGSHKDFVVTVLMDPKDAMGANILNQVCEYLKQEIEAQCPGEKGTMAILSNLNDQAVVTCIATLRGPDPTFARRLESGSRCAELDPHRAATHNKGIFNAVDAVLIATGNDWRAVEAGGHAFAAQNGRYGPLSTWRYENDTLVGTLKMPIVAGIVGGITNIHPQAKICLGMIQASSADELERLVAAMGLLQNFAALRALVTEGITKGHMRLHMRNWLYSLCQSPQEFAYAEKMLQQQLALKKRVTLQDVEKLLASYRSRKTA